MLLGAVYAVLHLLYVRVSDGSGWHLISDEVDPYVCMDWRSPCYEHCESGLRAVCPIAIVPKKRVSSMKGQNARESVERHMKSLNSPKE